MQPPLNVYVTYSMLLILTPILVSSTAGMNLDLVSLIAYHLNLHYRFNKIEPVMSCVGFVTFYIYVALEVLAEITQSFESVHRNTLNGRVRHDRFGQTRLQLREMFPPFIVSSFLIYANTTKFDVFRDSFIALQSIILVLYPIVCMYLGPELVYVCKCHYRSILFWTLLYSLFPRETSQIMRDVVDSITNGVYGRSSKVNQYWMF